MKIARSLIAALFILVAASACGSNPTAPAGPNFSPIIGSGIGE